MFCLTEDPVLPPVLHSLFDEFCFLTFLDVRKCRQPLSVFNITSSHNQCSALGRVYSREKGAFVFCADNSGVQRQGGYAGFLCNADGLLNQLKTEKGIRINYDKVKMSHWLCHNHDEVSWSAGLICVQCNGAEKAQSYKNRQCLCRVCWPKWAAPS